MMTVSCSTSPVGPTTHTIACVQISPLHMLDALCAWVMVGEAWGRLGCLTYGCCFGRPLNPPRMAVHMLADGVKAAAAETPANSAVDRSHCSPLERAQAAAVALVHSPLARLMAVAYTDKWVRLCAVLAHPVTLRPGHNDPAAVLCCRQPYHVLSGVFEHNALLCRHVWELCRAPGWTHLDHV